MTQRLVVRAAEDAGAGPRPRQEQILGALDDALREAAYADISVGRLAAAVGLARPGFYFYFPTKQAALIELLWRRAGEIPDGLGPKVAGEGSPHVAIRAQIRRAMRIWRRDEHLLRAVIDARATEPEIAAAWDAWMGGVIDAVGAAIAAEREAGRASGGVDVQVLAALLVGANVHALRERELTSRPQIDEATIIEALLSIWVGAIYGT